MLFVHGLGLFRHLGSSCRPPDPRGPKQRGSRPPVLQDAASFDPLVTMSSYRMSSCIPVITAGEAPIPSVERAHRKKKGPQDRRSERVNGIPPFEWIVVCSVQWDDGSTAS